MALVNPSIAMSFKPTTEYQPRNVLADYAQLQQIQSGQMQQEASRLQIDKIKRDESALSQMMQTITAKGGPKDPMEAADAMINSRNPDFMAAGLKLRQTYTETQQARAALGLPPLGAAAKPNALPMQPTLTPGELGSGTFDPNAPAAPTNALAPAVAPTAAPTAAPVNALASAANSPEVAQALEMMLSPNAAVAAAGKAAYDNLTQLQTVAPGGSIVRGGKPIYTAPAASKLLTPAEFQQEAQLRLLGRAPGSTVSINTQLPASEEAQKEFMKEMRQTYGALKQAPTVLQNIEDAKKLIPQAKGFMGAGGESVLQAASFLNNRLGTNIDTKGVKSAEELRSRLFLGIMDNLKKQDSQPSQQQQAALQIALGSIGTDPGALPAVLDVFGETVRQKVDLYNQEAISAEERGVKFPYKPTIALKPRNANQGAKPTTNPYSNLSNEELLKQLGGGK